MERPIVSQPAQYQLLMAPLVIQFQQQRKMLSVKYVLGLVLACICIMMIKQPVFFQAEVKIDTYVCTTLTPNISISKFSAREFLINIKGFLEVSFQFLSHKFFVILLCTKVVTSNPFALTL